MKFLTSLLFIFLHTGQKMLLRCTVLGKLDYSRSDHLHSKGRNVRPQERLCQQGLTCSSQSGWATKANGR